MAKKEFFYRGKKLEEIQAMSLNDFAELLPARSRRSIKRGFTDSQKKLLEQIKKFKAGKRKRPVKTHCRNMLIIPDMVGLMIHVHNGKTFVAIEIQAEMVGHYLGEFVQTRNRVAHSAPGVGATRSSSAVSVK
jgi:small subunit ribosomal protein S19